ncbi:MAG: PIN domain-containing protein [Candidatus Marsarchaeota archaeon]|nr:PIN domain-containing protein [Candidatus Marsarchaeota archaeon]
MKLFLDTSAIVELMHGNEEVEDAIESSESANVSPISVFEVLIGLKAKERKGGIPGEVAAFPVVPLTSRDAKRASASFALLSNKGKTVKLPDLLIAAQAAERNATLIAADKDFDVIASVDSGLSVRQIAQK